MALNAVFPPLLRRRQLAAGMALAALFLPHAARAQSTVQGIAQGVAQSAAPDAVQAGFRLMADRTGGNCIACHALPGQTGVQSSFGPALDAVGTRYDAATLRQWVSDARQIKPDTLMPPFGTTQGTHQPNRAAAMLTEDEITQVVAALQTLRQPATTNPK